MNTDPKLRGVVSPYSMNGDGPRASDQWDQNSPEFWFKRYTAQDTARERQRVARSKAGGDRSQFTVIPADEIGEPEHVRFSDSGVMLSTGVLRINGPAGSGKTRLAYWEVLQRVKSGDRWAIYDDEMGPQRYKQAMLQLGATPADLAAIDYMTTRNDVIPDLIAHGRAFCRVCLDAGCDGILYDSQTPFLAAAGVDENDPQGVRAWTDAAARPMAATGGTVIVIDHTGHEEGERGRGSSDKAAGCDLDMFLTVVARFAKGMDGIIGLTVAKDRSGTLLAGNSIRITVRCDEKGNVAFEPEQWIVYDSPDIDIAEILELVLLGNGRDYATAAELQKQVPGTKSDKIARIERAVRDLQINREKSGREYHYKLI